MIFSGNNLGGQGKLCSTEKNHNFCIDKSKIDIMIMQLSRCSHISSNLHFRKGGNNFLSVRYWRAILKFQS
jgi:hypothetical protein